MDDSGDVALPAKPQINDTGPDLQAVVARMQRQHTRTQRAQTAPAALREIPHVGRYMLAAQNSYAAHRQLIADTSLALQFSPRAQPTFDVFVTSAPHGMQPMLSAFRNALMQQFFADRATPDKIMHLSAIARYAATQLAALTTDGKGAQALYAALLSRQHTPLWRMPSVWFKPADRPQHWALVPLDQSPFSDAALAMKPPAPDMQISDVSNVEIVEMAERNSIDPQRAEAERAQTAAAELNEIANDMASAGALTMSVEELHEPTKREAIELAKDILNKLRVQLGEALIEHGLSHFDVNPLVILGELKQVVKAFEFHLHKVAGLDAKIYENPAVEAANKAVGKLSYLAKSETLHAAQQHGDVQMMALVAADLAQLPDAWKPASGDTFTALFDDLESGLKAVIERITQLADKDTTAEFWLGFSAEKSIGNTDPSKQKNSPEKAMDDDTYYRQMNAQRALRARQAAVRYTQTMQRQRTGHHEEDHHHHHAEPTKPVSMNQLVNNDLLASMRNAMKTSAGAGAVQTGAKANIQQVVQQKENVMRGQRQRVTQEQIRRTNQRQQEHRHDDHHNHDQPLQPPPGKKKDHSHGL